MKTKQNPVAKALRKDRFKQRKVKPKKGKGSYRRVKSGQAERAGNDGDRTGSLKL